MYSKEEQERIQANEEERLQRLEAECDSCGYIMPIPYGQGIIGPEGETVDCPECKKGTMKDRK